MTRPYLSNNKDGYGTRDRVFDYFHESEFCFDPVTVDIINKWVPPPARRNKWVSKLICLMFHSEHYRNRTDPEQIRYRFYLVNRMINATDRHEIQYYMENVANQEELDNLVEQFSITQSDIGEFMRMAGKGNARLAKEKADLNQSA